MTPMRAIPVKLLYSLIIALILLAVTGIAYACGPFFNEYIYMPDDSDTYYPLQDASTLFNSTYGLILSGWGPEYLYPVYMDLTGRKIFEDTKKALLLYYDSGFSFSNGESDWNEWERIRKTVVSEDIKKTEYAAYDDGYNFYVNCNSSAFATARETLEKRKEIYSKDQLTAWVKRQDEVFSNCGIPLTKKIILPERTDISSFISDAFLTIRSWLPIKQATLRPVKAPIADELFQFDKEYQEAAMDFYQANFDAAERKFRKIADNYDHPWREYASLVIGRIYIRKAELGTVEKYDASDKPEDIKKDQKIRDRWYAKAEKQFNKILIDSSLAEIHSGAKDLLNFVLFRINPKKRLKIAEDVLLASNEASEIISNIEDYSLLWSRGGQSRNNEEEQKDWEKYILRDGGGFYPVGLYMETRRAGKFKIFA